MTKSYRLGGLNNRNLFSQSSGGCKLQIEAGLVIGKGFLPMLQSSAFSIFPVSPYWLFSVLACKETSGVLSSSYKDFSPIRLELYLYDLI
jgi:hypothetical protein